LISKCLTKCCLNAPAYKVPRGIHEGARDMARDIAHCLTWNAPEWWPVASVVHGSDGGAEAQGDVGDRPPKLRMPILPFKLNQNRRHHTSRAHDAR